MRLMVYMGQTRFLTAAICACCIGIGIFPASAINYNDGNSTNYLGGTTNNVIRDFRLKVGVDEANNTLYVTNGGLAAVTEVYVGEGTDSINNLLCITNGGLVFAGSIDTNNATTGGVYVGDTSGNGIVVVDNKSELDTDYLYLGKGTNESGQVDVAGGGMLSIREQLYVGSTNNANNTLTISDNGAVFINETSDLIISNIDGATNDFNKVDIESSGKLLIGGDVDATALIATSNLNFKTGAVLGIGGELAIDDSAIEDSLNIVLDNALSTSTSRWTTSEIYIGDSTKNNSLTLTNGATATATDIVYVGNKTAASGNSLNVYGSNSLLNAQNKLFVGSKGDNNALEVSDGGSATVALDLKVGASSGADGNSVFIGTNGTLTVGQKIIVGDNGNRNSFTVEDGQVNAMDDFILGSSGSNNRYTQTGGTNTIAGDFILGENEGASGATYTGQGAFQSDSKMTDGNLAFIGSNALVTIEQNLNVGVEGAGSVFVIRDGGSVDVDEDAVIGEDAGDNVIYLQRGSNTTFHVAGNLVIGKTEEGSNRFAAYGGTATIDGDVLLGATTNQHEIKNFIRLQTTNASLNVANLLNIGASNSVNTMDIVDGATATAQNIYIGTYEGVYSNTVTVKGEDSLLQVTNILSIGSTTGTNNAVVIKTGGILFVSSQTNIVISGTNNTLTLADGGTLKTGGWDFGAQTNMATNIVFNSGATLHLFGTLTGTNMAEGGLGYVLDGTNSSWNTGTNDIYVGHKTDNNSLMITNGATASTSSNLFIGYLSTGNSVVVGGADSLLNIGSDLHIGSETNGPVQSSPYYPPTIPSNTVAVLDGAKLNIANDAFLYNGAVLKIGSSAQVSVGGDYSQDEYSTLEIGISSNQVQPNLIVGGTAAFAKSSDTNTYPLLRVTNEGISESNVVTIVQAGSITVDGENATPGNIKANIATNLLLDFNVTVSNDANNSYIVLDDFIISSLGEAAGLSGQLLTIANEIESLTNSAAKPMLNILADMDQATAYRTMDNHYGEKMSSTPAHNTINMGIQSVAEQLTKRSDNTRARVSAANNGMSAPAGAQGPHMADQELQGWITGFKTWADRSANGGFDGYDGSINGFLIGTDLAVADGFLFGAAGGSASSTLDKDNGASTDTSTKVGSIYASVGTKDWFADASFIYGSSTVDSKLGDVFETKAEYDAENIAFYVGGGKEIIGDYLILTPQASLLGNYYSQDSYEETSTSALPRKVDSFDTIYFQSAVGCNIGFYAAMGETTIKPEFRVFWLHEFNAKEEDLAYSIVDVTGSYNMQMQAPESDILKLGGGLSAKIGEYLELRADLDARVAESYSDYTVLGSIRYQF